MSFEALIAKVHQAEQSLEASERKTAVEWEQLKHRWIVGWTPARIVVGGLVAGFMVGRSKPLRVTSGGGVLNLVSALSALFAGSSAQAAASEAEEAAGAADTVAAAAAPNAAALPGQDFSDLP